MKQQSGFRGAGARPWSADDDRLLLEARDLGFTFDEIAALLGRDVTAGAIRMRLAKLQHRAEEQRVAARGRPRDCLRCRKPFQSEGAHNRLCDLCRAFANGLSPMAPDWCADDEDGHEGACDDTEAVPLPTAPLAVHPWRKPHRPTAAAASAQSDPPGGVKVAAKEGAPAAPGNNVHRDHRALQKLPTVNLRRTEP